MFTGRRIQSLCLMIIVSVLLMGMCPIGIGADSFFASNQSRSTSGNIIRPTASTATRPVAYTHEIAPEYETAFTPVGNARRISMRHSARVCFATVGLLCFSWIFSGLSGHHTGHLFDEIVSNTVIISYIHHQDGAKA